MYSASGPTRQILALAAELSNKGELRQAESLYQAMTNEFPTHGPSLYHLGMVKRQLGDLPAAVDLIRKAVLHHPADAAMQGSLALLYKEMGQPANAVRHFQEMIRLGQGSADVHCLLGDCYMDLGEADNAIAQFRGALAQEPTLEEIWINLGLCLRSKGDIAEAQRCGETGLSHHPDSVILHVNHALTLLSAGHYRQGWREYHWRLRLENTANFLQNVVGDLRLWQGEPLDHANILVVSEQGYGDAIQFVRYLAELKALGARVFFHCPSALAPLVREAPGVDEVVSGEVSSGFPFDFYVPLLSLPERLGTQGFNIPARIPYLHPDPERVERWQPLFTGPGLRVGVTWQGQSLHPNDPFRRRSLDPDLLQPLLSVAGVAFYNLQPNNAIPGIMDLGPFLTNFAETAALMAHLDLVISIDTAVAHLAGALGKPVWTLLPMAPDWRWGVTGETNPWYPTMRLFRMEQPGCWQGAVAKISQELTKLVARQDP